MEATRNRQIPWEHSALRSKFFFSAPAPAASMSKANTQAEIELAYWNAAQASGNAGAFRSYLERYPHGAYAGSATLMLDKLREEEASRVALADREAELRKAEEEKKKTEDAKRAEELAVAREEVRKAQDATRAETQRLAALKTAAEAAKASTLKRDAERHSEPTKLAASLQSELKRVGCDPGSSDGNWGPKSKDALRTFARVTKIPISEEVPTEAALAAVTGQKGRVCTTICSPTETEQNGKCVSIVRREPSKAQRTQRSDGEEKGSTKMCWAGSATAGNQFVPCSDSRAVGR